MLPTRTASAFHAAVHDLKVARLARAAARVEELLTAQSVTPLTIAMPNKTPKPAETVRPQTKQQIWNWKPPAFEQHPLGQ